MLLGIRKMMMSLIALMVLTGFSLPAAAEIKIGYIDMQTAIQKTKAGKKAKKKLEKEFKKRKKDLEKKEADLKKMNEDLSKKALVMSDEARLKKQQGLQQEMIKFRELVGKNQLEMQKKEVELMKPILEKLNKIVNEVAEKDGYTVILSKQGQGVLWAKKEIDLTETVVKRFNK